MGIFERKRKKGDGRGGEEHMNGDRAMNAIEKAAMEVAIEDRREVNGNGTVGLIREKRLPPQVLQLRSGASKSKAGKG